VIKKFFLILLILSIGKLSYAENWSNDKKYPTNINAAEQYIFDKHRQIEKKINKDFDYPLLQGIWYGQYLGWVGIYEEEYQSGVYKMFLIKAPKGYGYSKIPGFEPETFFATNKDHEGTLEGTLRKIGEREYDVKSKIWYLQNDGSYKYVNSTGKIEVLSDGHFKWTNPELKGENKESTFIKLGYWLKSKLIDIDSSNKNYTDYEIETSTGVFVYFDTKVKNHNLFGKSVYDKFWHFDYKTGDVSTGQIIREIDGSSRGSIKNVYCVNKGSGNGLPNRLYYSSTIPGELTVKKIIKNKCDPQKITYSTYMHYINRQYYWAGGISLSLIVIFFFLKIQRSQELAAHNKNNKNKFETYSEFKEYKKKIEDRESLKQAAKEEKERKAEEAKLAREAKAEEIKIKAEERRLEREEKRNKKTQFEEPEDDYDENLMGKVKRLKKLYTSGTLSKAEFEKAKNKLLK
jgi:hypothetical protein